MSDDDADRFDGLDGEERRLADLFAQVDAPASMRRWGVSSTAVPARRGWGSRLVGALIGSAGERHLRPLAAALVLPVLVLAAGGAMGLRSHLSSSRSGGTAPNPPARVAAAMAFDADHGVVVMFGGEGSGGLLDDTWTWDGDAWTEQHPPTSPLPRYGAAMGYDATHHQVVMFGGNGSTPGNETWTWSGSTWHRVATAHAPDPMQSGMGFDSGTGQLLLVGMGTGSMFGSNVRSVPGVVHTLQPAPAGPLHVPAGVPPPTPVAVSGGPVMVPLHPVAPPPVQGPSVGVRVPAMQSTGDVTTWVWTGSDWAEQSVSAAPHGSFGPLHPAWDAAHREMLLVTVEVPSCAEASTAQSVPLAVPAPGVAGAGSPGWTGYSPQPTTSPAPSVTHDLQLAPAPLPCGAARTTPIGPCSGCVHVQQWSWDGRAWHSIEGADSQFPPQIVPDPATGRLVAFASDSTLELTGSTWKHTANPADLQRRTGASLAADTERKVVVLFGGRRMGAAGYGSDTWTWDGHGWTRRAGVPAPLPTPYVAERPPTPPCNAAPLPKVTVAPAPLDAVAITLTYVYSFQCSPVVQLVDQVTALPLKVQGNLNAVVLTLPSPQTLVWRNWCGTEVPRLSVNVGSSTVQLIVSPLPTCVDARQPSMLTFGNSGVPHAIP